MNNLYLVFVDRGYKRRWLWCTPPPLNLVFDGGDRHLLPSLLSIVAHRPHTLPSLSPNIMEVGTDKSSPRRQRRA